jgi:hypothetical protein
MRVRVVRWTDPTSSLVNLRVQRWCAGQWERVMDFPLNESENANEFAVKLSLTKRFPVEVSVFEDGTKVESGLAPIFMVDTGNDEKQSESPL